MVTREFMLRLIVVAVSLLLVFGIAWASAYQLEMGDRLSPRYWFHAIPEVLSHRHGLKWDFTTYQGILNLVGSSFLNQILIPAVDAGTARVTGEAILQSARAAADFDRTLVMIPFDDKGYADFTRLAFALFGVHVTSILKAYLLILQISVLAYVFRFWRCLPALVLLLFVLTGVYLGTFAFPASRELGEITNPRAIGMLSYVSMAHLIAAVIWEGPRRWTDIALAALQVAVLLLVFFCRSPEIWQLAVVFLVSAVIAVRQWTQNRSVPRALVVCGLVLAGSFCLTIYQRVVFNPAYFSAYGQYRLTWHNLGIGFSLHPDLAKKYDLRIGDNGMFNLVAARARPLGLYERIFSGRDALLSNPIGDFVLYEKLARDVVLEIVRDNPVNAISTFLYYKPIEFLGTMDEAIGGRWMGRKPSDVEARYISDAERNRMGAWLDFFRPLGVLSFAAGVIALLCISRRDRSAIAGIVALIAMGSLLPGFIAYPVYHVIGASFAAVVALVYLAIAIIIVEAVRRIAPLPRRPTLPVTDARHQRQ